MNQNPTRTLWISVLLGVFAMFLIYSYSQEKKAEYDKTYGLKINVVVARSDIQEMRTIDDTMLEMQEIPDGFKQPGYITDLSEVVGFVAAAPIKKGEQILNTKLLSPGTDTGLSMQIAPEKRAIAIPVDETRGIAKLIRPGDRIDIITAIDPGRGQNSRTEVKTLLQNVTVLATGVNITNNIPRKLETNTYNNTSSYRRLTGDTSFATITVEVTPKEAQDLIVLMSSSPGSIFLSLRNPNDVNIPTLNPSSVSTVLGRVSPSLLDDVPRVPASYVPPPPAPTPAPRLPPKKKKGPFVEVN